MDLTVIRPLMYVNEADVIGFVNKYNLPVMKSACPVDGYTKRQYASDLLDQLIKENPGVKERMFTAIQRANLESKIKQQEKQLLQKDKEIAKLKQEPRKYYWFSSLSCS